MSAENMKVLFVDDEDEVCQLMEMRFKAHGYETIISKSGKDGIEKAIREKPAIIILDQIMPEMTGVETCKKLKENPATRRIPVIIFTWYTGDGFEESCVAAGASAVVYKPITSDLLDIIKKVVVEHINIWEEDIEE